MKKSFSETKKQNPYHALSIAQKASAMASGFSKEELIGKDWDWYDEHLEEIDYKKGDSIKPKQLQFLINNYELTVEELIEIKNCTYEKARFYIQELAKNDNE